MASKEKDQICALLKAIEMGDPEAVTVVNEAVIISPARIAGSAGILIHTGGGIDLLSKFVRKDPERGRLVEAEFKIEFSRWKERRENKAQD